MAEESRTGPSQALSCAPSKALPPLPPTIYWQGLNGTKNGVPFPLPCPVTASKGSMLVTSDGRHHQEQNEKGSRLWMGAQVECASGLRKGAGRPWPGQKSKPVQDLENGGGRTGVSGSADTERAAARQKESQPPHLPHSFLAAGATESRICPPGKWSLWRTSQGCSHPPGSLW